jgi:hypothetical protein
MHFTKNEFLRILYTAFHKIRLTALLIITDTFVYSNDNLLQSPIYCAIIKGDDVKNKPDSLFYHRIICF